MSDSDPLEANWKAFEKLQETITAEHIGRTALLHDGELVAIYNDSGDAYQVGVEKFGEGNFSVQTFGEAPISLGFLANYGQIFQGAA